MGKKVAIWLLKWLVVPVGFAAAGYLVIGPRIGSEPPKALKEVSAQLPVPIKTANNNTPEGAAKPEKSFPEPDVTVRITQIEGQDVGGNEEEQASREIRSEPKTQPENSEPPAEDTSSTPKPEDEATDPPATLPDGNELPGDGTTTI